MAVGRVGCQQALSPSKTSCHACHTSSRVTLMTKFQLWNSFPCKPSSTQAFSTFFRGGFAASCLTLLKLQLWLHSLSPHHISSFAMPPWCFLSQPRVLEGSSGLLLSHGCHSLGDLWNQATTVLQVSVNCRRCPPSHAFHQLYIHC